MEAEVSSAPASSERLPWYALAALAALLPAVGVALAAKGVMDIFRGMAITGSGGPGNTLAGMSEANHAVIFTAAAAGALAGWLAITAMRRPQRTAAFPGIALSLGPILACVPALLLWISESIIQDVVLGDDTRASTIGDTAQRLANLMIASAGVPVVIIPIVLVAFAVTLARRHPRTESGPPLAVFWAAVAMLLLGIAAAFYLRSSQMFQAALAS